MNITAISYAANASIILIAILTVWAEENKGLKDAIATLGGHHWVGKGVIAVVLMAVLYFILNKTLKDKAPDKALYSTMVVSVLSGLVIFIYYGFIH